MGQRLNLEIANNGETLANAYYHWSGYTSSAIELISTVLNALDSRTNESDLEWAVKLLEITGAGINEGEADRVKDDTTGRFANISFKPACDRNEGLIAVTEQGIQETRCWEEARAVVDFGLETINFKVLWEEDAESYREVWEKDIETLKPHDEWNLAQIPFAEFDSFTEFVDRTPNGFRAPNGNAICWIE